MADLGDAYKKESFDIDAIRNEIKQAIRADKDGYKFEPMYEIQRAIRSLAEGFEIGGVPPGLWLEFADYLAGGHRNAKHIKTNPVSGKVAQRMIDIDRAKQFNNFMQSGLSRSKALGKLAQLECDTTSAGTSPDIRTLERGIDKGIKYMQENNEALALEIRAKKQQLKIMALELEYQQQVINRHSLLKALVDSLQTD